MLSSPVGEFFSELQTTEIPGEFMKHTVYQGKYADYRIDWVGNSAGKGFILSRGLHLRGNTPITHHTTSYNDSLLR
jgi:hypothetical protein